MCFEFFNRFSVALKIVGVNKTGEIDETVDVRRKYNVGGVVHLVWLVGEIQRGTENNAVVQIVENIKVNTLNELIL